MKTKIEFILPLPNQAIEILKKVQQFSGDGKYIFPSFRTKDKPMSDNTLISTIRRMDFTKDEFVPHSFRAMFSTIAYENMNIENGHNYSGGVIEALLSHKESMKELLNWYALKIDNIKTFILLQ